MWIRKRIRVWWPKMKKKIQLDIFVKSFFDKKNCYLLIPRPSILHKGLKPSALKREHPSFQKIKFIKCFLFFWVIFILLDPEHCKPLTTGTKKQKTTLKIFAGKRLIEIDKFSVSNFRAFFTALFFTDLVSSPNTVNVLYVLWNKVTSFLYHPLIYSTVPYTAVLI